LVAPTVAALGTVSISWLVCELWLGRHQGTSILYSAKQIDLLNNVAAALIPTVTGFAIIAASGLAFLRSKGHTRSAVIRVSAFGVFFLLVLSIASWVWMLGGLVDCSLAFDRIADAASAAALTMNQVRRLNGEWVMAVTFAKLASVEFF